MHNRLKTMALDLGRVGERGDGGGVARGQLLGFAAMAIRGYYLGCPAWGFKEWVGELYRRGARPAEFLSQYASVFNTVEGNTTFYSLPSAETVERWREATSEDFRFCFKFPQEVTHRQGLRGSGAETAGFLARLAPLGERLGPFMLQLPPAFGPERSSVLERFLRELPPDFQYAVELRHPAFYTDRDAGRRIDALLARWSCDRVIMDTRALRSGDDQHPGVTGARHRKPDLPVRPDPAGRRPLVRFIGHPDAEVNDPWMETWSRTLSTWMAQGLAPYFFVHCPDNAHAPASARRFHLRLSALASCGEMPTWPGETGQLSLL